MDQKKTLWIVIASGIFLFVVIGSAVILSAKNAKLENTADALKNNDFWVASVPDLPSDNFSQQGLKAKTAAPVQEEIPAAETIVPAPVNTNSTVEGYNGKDNIQAITQNGTLTVIASGPTNVISTNGTEVTGVTTIDLNTLKSSHPAKPEFEEKPPVKKEEPKPAPKKPEPKPAKKEEAKPAKKAEPAPAKKPAPEVKKITQYWVQAASYSTKKNADEARTVLDSNGVQCEVFTYKDSADKLFYRVRVGPYTTKAEAEYWKGRIETIDLFSKTGSYVTSTSVAK